MKRCILYGNCQAEVIAKILSEHVPFAERYSVEYVCNYDSMTRGVVLPTQAFSWADVLIYQPIHGVSIVTGKECKMLSFPYLFNSGMFAMYEENDYVHGADQIRKMKWLRVPCESVVEMAIGGKLFFDLKYRFEESLSRLIKREAACSIKVAARAIMENLKRQRVFFTQNHVASIVLFPIVNSILETLDFEPMPLGVERMATGAWPVSPYEVSELALEYGISQGWDEYMGHCIRRIYSENEWL